MKKISIALAAVALSGCAAMSAISAASSVVSALSPAASAGADRVVLEGTRGLVLANNAYQGASAALVPLINNGKLTRDQLLRVRDIDNQVYGLLTKADSGLTEAQRVAKALNLVDELNRMAGK
jgi:hypothetical protein